MIDYILTHIWQLWLFVSIMCLILELSSGDFFIMCFSIGALVATLTAAAGLGFTAQIITFALCSALCIFFVRPVALKYLHHNRDARVSNADAIIGRTATVSEDISAGGYGRVALDGDDWKAQAENPEDYFAKGEKVRIVGRESIIVTVTKA